jgi:hypothetical protein
MTTLKGGSALWEWDHDLPAGVGMGYADDGGGIADGVGGGRGVAAEVFGEGAGAGTLDGESSFFVGVGLGRRGHRAVGDAVRIPGEHDSCAGRSAEGGPAGGGPGGGATGPAVGHLWQTPDAESAGGGGVGDPGAGRIEALPPRPKAPDEDAGCIALS